MKQKKTVAVVGTGLMGAGIAEVATLAGYETTLLKATPGNPQDARERIQRSMAKGVAKHKLSDAAMELALARLHCTSDRDRVLEADIVIESIVEDKRIKQALFEDLGRRTKNDAILASNTSTLRISELAPASKRQRTIGMHFFSPVPVMKLVELAHLSDTDDDVIQAGTDFISSLGKTAVPVVDSSGFVVNRLLVPYLIGAISAYAQGLAPADEIDQAMKLGCGHPMGPLALADAIGLDIVFNMSRLLHQEFGESRYRSPAILRRMVQDGHLGKKAGLGFYDYRNGQRVENSAVKALIGRGVSHAA